MSGCGLSEGQQALCPLNSTLVSPFPGLWESRRKSHTPT